MRNESKQWITSSIKNYYSEIQTSIRRVTGSTDKQDQNTDLISQSIRRGDVQKASRSSSPVDV